MELINKVLIAFKLCQSKECDGCPYFIRRSCAFQLLARDAEIVIKQLLKNEESDT